VPNRQSKPLSFRCSGSRDTERRNHGRCRVDGADVQSQGRSHRRQQQDGRGITEDDLLEATLDADPEEINDLGDTFEIITDPSNTVAVRTAVEQAGFDYESAEVSFVPQYNTGS
jgi:hypothetical protein